MKIGVVGAGRWGINHVRTLKRIGNLGLVVEVDPKTREAVKSELHGVKLVDTMDEGLRSDVKGLIIATPVPTHFALAKKALEAGKDVLVEKPLCLNSREADELVEIAQKGNRVLMVGHMLLFSPAIRFIKEFLSAGKLGTLHTIHQTRLNLGTARKVENALWSLGVHDVALALWLVGQEPNRVACVGQRILQTNIEDDVHLHLSFPNGVQTHLHASWLNPTKSRGMTLIGAKGMLVYEEGTQAVTFHKKTIDAELKNQNQGEEVVFQKTSEPLEEELRHFAECIRTRKTPDADGKQGAAVLRILEQADQAMMRT